MPKIFYDSFSTWGKVVFMLALLLIVVCTFKTEKEGFTVLEGYTEKTNDNLFDKFYSDIYDYLAFSEVRNDYEFSEILGITKPNNKSVILDVGCGTGNIVNLFNEKGYNIIGVDKSSHMVKKTVEKFPELKGKIITGNVLKTQLFPPFYFSHILCLYFTIYYIDNKTLFFENVFDWLKPGGFFILHLVNRDNFSPILPMNSHKRGKKGKYTKIEFNDFNYESTFDLTKTTNTAVFNERFKSETGVRKNKHTFYMEDQKTILLMAQNCGFIVQQQIDMKSIKYDYQYLYVLSKPN